MFKDKYENKGLIINVLTDIVATFFITDTSLFIYLILTTDKITSESCGSYIFKH